MNAIQKLVQEKLAPRLRSPCLYDIPMRELTTFRIGGPADCFILLASFDDVPAILEFSRQTNVSYLVIGKGSNLLVSDRGIRGIVIKIDDGVDGCDVQGECIRAEAGFGLWRLSEFACVQGLSGLEFACGIPGNLGGAIYMNAGAYGGEMKDVVEWVRLIAEDGSEMTLRVEDPACGGDEMEFGYRRSILQRRNMIVREVCVKLHHADRRAIEEKVQELTARRARRQPLDLPSAGSTFRRPPRERDLRPRERDLRPDTYAGKLIADAGLQGYRIGGAEVSAKHAGFIVNAGGASCNEVRKLIEHIQNVVHGKFGVMLEPEIKIVGEF